MKSNQKPCNTVNKINKISLNERLERLKYGHAGDPQYYVSAIRSMADYPIVAYMGAFKEELSRLLTLLDIGREEAKEMTYQQTAVHIMGIMAQTKDKERIKEIFELLIVPVLNCFEKRRLCYGYKKED